MTKGEARAAIDLYRQERSEGDSNPWTFGVSYEELTDLLTELSKHYIHIRENETGDCYIPTVEQLVIFAHVLLNNATTYGWPLDNLRKAMSTLIDDNEFTVFMTRYEG